MASSVETEFFNDLQRFVLSEYQLKSNGYPLFDPENPDTAQISSTYGSASRKRDDQRECDRCHKVFRVDSDGRCLATETCRYHTRRGIKRGGASPTIRADIQVHPGRILNKLTCSLLSWFAGSMIHPCCDGNAPCVSFRTHVYKWLDRTGYVRTEPRSIPSGASAGVYAVDTEMVWTTKGFEVALVTVIDMHLETVYESLVKPEGEIVDYNTRFSGIEPGQFDNIDTRLKDVHRRLLELFCDKTILMGHSLESDLEALKIIHPTVVDTSIVYPHRRGPPLKRGLKALAEDFLRKEIQTGRGGHDSTEDAIAVMELMLLKTGHRR